MLNYKEDEKVKGFVDKFNQLSPFFRVSIVLVNLVLFFGVIGPSMISSNSTVAVWIGIALLIADAYVVYIFSRKTITELMK